MTTSLALVIIVTSVATYLSRVLGVLSSEKIKETSKIYRWFNCLAYSTLAALIARMIIFPSGTLTEVNYSIRIIVLILSILISGNIICSANKGLHNKILKILKPVSK